MAQLLDALRSGRVLLMDGAMGTELQRAGLRDGECGEAWNISHPERIRAIHQAYVGAGAQCLLTNTFQANSRSLGRLGLDNYLEEMVRRGNELARAVAGPDKFVIGDIGPLGDGNLIADVAPLLNAFGDVDAFLVETSSDTRDLVLILRRLIEEARPVPVLMSLTAQP